MTDARLERWLSDVLATPGLTAIRDRDEARAMLLEDALRGLDVVRAFDGPIVDVGSGGGSPGIPLAAALPERDVTLLEANARKAHFLERVAAGFPNVSVVRGRAEEQEADLFGVALAKALAPPPVALEWALVLVRPGGAAVLWLGPRRISKSWREWLSNWGAAYPRGRPAWSSCPRLDRLRRASRAAPAWPGNVLSPD